MTIENTVNAYTEILKRKLKELEKKDRIPALENFILGMTDIELNKFNLKEFCSSDRKKYSFFYAYADTILSDFGPLEIGTAKELLNAKLGKLRKKLERKSWIASIYSRFKDFYGKQGEEARKYLG